MSRNRRTGEREAGTQGDAQDIVLGEGMLGAGGTNGRGGERDGNEGVVQHAAGGAIGGHAARGRWSDDSRHRLNCAERVSRVHCPSRL